MNAAYIEDDLDARTIFARKFNEAGVQCDTFRTAEDFLKVAAPGGYDLLLIDIRLPGSNGIKLLKELRQQNIFTPAIIITAFNSTEYAREALNSGANYLLEKPFSFGSLLRIVRKVLASPQSLQDCVDRGFAPLNLAKREEEIARLLLKGLSNKEIAEMAQISEKTVKHYITQVFEKAEVSSRAEFFSYIFPV